MDKILNENDIHILNTKFDKIYVIHCVEDKIRYNNIQYQIEQSGIDLDIWWTTKTQPFSEQMLNGILLSGYGRYIINKNELNLAREFYSIIKISYERGFNNILIFEDDFSLMKNEYINEFISNIPNDFDIIQFSTLANKKLFDYNKLIKTYSEGKLFIECNSGFWSNNGLALSRKGMKYFLDYYNSEFVAADIPQFEFNNTDKFFGKTYIKEKNQDIKSYISTVPLVYLQYSLNSNVQDHDDPSKKELYEYYNLLDKQYYYIYNKNIKSISENN